MRFLKLLALATVSAVSAGASGCCEAPPAEQHAEASRTLVLEVDGMVCRSCSGKVENALGDLPGVSAVHVNLTLGRVLIAASAAGPDDQTLVETVKKAGFKPGALRPEKDGFAAAKERLKAEALRKLES